MATVLLVPRQMATSLLTSKAAHLHLLQEKAVLLRIDSVRATTEASSGHPTSCASAAEIVSALFFSVMRFDPQSPNSDANDVFLLSKGHAAPLLYAAWAEAGAFPREKLLTLRRIDSDLEGHPTPRLPFVDVATGSLGQGLSVGLGIAVNAKRFLRSDQRVYVLIGDGESAEGSIWEAAQWASLHQLDNLCVTLDINRLGQSQPTMLQHHLEVYKSRWASFGWQAIPVDGHDMEELLAAYEKAQETIGRPTIVLARTTKGKGFPGIEGSEHWHGKALDRETADKVIAELNKQIGGAHVEWEPKLPSSIGRPAVPEKQSGKPAAPPYSITGKEVSTRKGFGEALAVPIVSCKVISPSRIWRGSRWDLRHEGRFRLWRPSPASSRAPSTSSACPRLAISISSSWERMPAFRLGRMDPPKWGLRISP